MEIFHVLKLIQILFSAGVTPHSEIESRVRFATPTEETKTFIATANKSTPAKITRLSFDDYHTTWSGIATSKPAHQMKNPRRSCY